MIGIKSQFIRSKCVPVLLKDAMALLLLLCIFMIAEMFLLKFAKAGPHQTMRNNKGIEVLWLVVVFLKMRSNLNNNLGCGFQP